jgi:methionyl aminopeptidase
MSIESEADWNGLRRVGQIVRLTLDALERDLRPGITTGELDRVAARILAEQGARSAPAMAYGFPGTVLISINDQVVHGVPGARHVRRHDLVKLDVTVEKDGYVADAARTVLVEGGSAKARRLRACAMDAFQASLRVARAGNRVSEIGRAVEDEVRRQGFSVIRGLAGHGVGRAIHEAPSVPNYYEPRQTDVLTNGLVITIEPIICAGSERVVEERDGWRSDPRWQPVGASRAHDRDHAREPVILTAA